MQIPEITAEQLLGKYEALLLDAYGVLLHSTGSMPDAAAFVERLNLTMRQGVSALIRRTWARAESASELALRLEWWRAHYHFVRYHQALQVTLAQPLEWGR